MKVRRKDSIVHRVTESRLEIRGNSECVVDGMKGIIEYNNDRIKINLGKYNVIILGDELYINTFSREGAVVQGNIISMEFDSNG